MAEHQAEDQHNIVQKEKILSRRTHIKWRQHKVKLEEKQNFGQEDGRIITKRLLNS